MAAVTDHSGVKSTSSEPYRKASEAAGFIKSKLPDHLQRPRIAIVCGSGLGGIAGIIDQDDKAEIEYAHVPNFPEPTGKPRRCFVVRFYVLK